MSVPHGSIVTYKAQWDTGFWNTATDSVQEVSSQLASMGFTVLSQANDASPINGILQKPVNFTMQIEIDSGLDYASADDVKSILDHGVYVATGNLPVASSIPSIQVPSGGTQTTGQPGSTSPAGTTSGCIAGSSSNTSGGFDVICWFKNLTTTGFASVGVLALLAVLGIGIFIFASGRIPRAA